MKKITFLLSLLFMTLMSFAQVKQVKVKLHGITGYGQYEKFAKRAALALEDAINSDEFKTQMLGLEYLKTKGLTNQQLYEKIMAAHEESGEGGEDGVIDLRVRTLRVDGDESRWKNRCNAGSKIGIDGNGDGVTAICPQVLEFWANENNVAELAGHYAHEYMHIIGFDHYRFLGGTQSWRKKTFVYKIGDLVADLVDKQIKSDKKN